jgi:hypothetical protein
MNWHYKKICFSAAAIIAACTRLVDANSNCCDFGCDLPSCTSYYDGGWTFSGDMLYWKARGSNITYNQGYVNATEVVEEEIDTGPFQGVAIVVVRDQKVKNKGLKFDQNFGYRLGLNYDMCCSCYGFGAEWTHFKTQANGKIRGLKHEFCVREENEVDEYKIGTKWNLHLDMLDLMASREFCIDQCLSLRASFGVRYARITQDYKSFAEYAFETGEFFEPVVGTFRQLIQAEFASNEDLFDVKEKHYFNGAGPRFGLDLEWGVGCGLSIYGNAAFSFLVGYSNHSAKNFQEVSSQTLAAADTGSELYVLGVLFDEERVFERDECLQANRPITDLGVGFRWIPQFSCCPYNVSFQLGFEHHAYFGHALPNSHPLESFSRTQNQRNSSADATSFQYRTHQSIRTLNF